MLKENLAKVEENIQAACDRAGRKRRGYVDRSKQNKTCRDAAGSI